MDKKTFWEYMKISVITVVVMILILILISCVAQRTVVNGDSMYPTLENNESVIVNKLAYKFEEIERFDVVIFPHYNEKKSEEIFYVKRVIGMPGEIIRIENGNIYINDEQLEEYYGYYDMDLPFFEGVAQDDYYIGEDEYFVIGDNRNNSEDSRTFGCISEDIITGKAAFRIYPFSRIGKIR